MSDAAEFVIRDLRYPRRCAHGDAPMAWEVDGLYSGYQHIMRAHTYSKFSPELADAVDLQALLDKLADFLLQSGFAGGGGPSHFGFDFGDEGVRSMDALRQAIIDALLASDQFTPEMLKALRGEGSPESQAQLAK